MTENERLRLIMNHLNFKTQKEVAEKLNIKQGSYSDILRAKDGMRISNAIKFKLEALFNVNLYWLETGIGDMFLKKGPTISEVKDGVPYFDIRLAEMETPVLNEEKAEYFVNYRPFNDCTAYLPVYGDSMYPKYASGDIVAVKQIYNFDILQWGEAYVVMTDDNSNALRSIKLVFEHPDKTKIILRSSNPNFKGDIIVSRENIVSMYIIKGKITRNLI